MHELSNYLEEDMEYIPLEWEERDDSVDYYDPPYRDCSLDPSFWEAYLSDFYYYYNEQTEEYYILSTAEYNIIWEDDDEESYNNDARGDYYVGVDIKFDKYFNVDLIEVDRSCNDLFDYETKTYKKQVNDIKKMFKKNHDIIEIYKYINDNMLNSSDIPSKYHFDEIITNI